jgi:hypothetical protein
MIGRISCRRDINLETDVVDEEARPIVPVRGCHNGVKHMLAGQEDSEKFILRAACDQEVRGVISQREEDGPELGILERTGTNVLQTKRGHRDFLSLKR